MADEILINVNVEGQTSLDSVNKKLEKTGEYSEKATSEIGLLRRELKDAKSDMLKYAEGTEQYNKALLKASQLQGKLKETNDIVKASVRDLGSTVKMVGGAIGGLASGFQVAQGAMALFGAESEASLKVIQNITAAMSITQGIVQFANGFDDLQDLLVGFRAESAKTKGAISEISKVSKEAGSELGNVAKEGAVIGSNLAGGTIGAVKTSESIKDLTKTLSDLKNASNEIDLKRIDINTNQTQVPSNDLDVTKQHIELIKEQKRIQYEMLDNVSKKQNKTVTDLLEQQNITKKIKELEESRLFLTNRHIELATKESEAFVMARRQMFNSELQYKRSLTDSNLTDSMVDVNNKMNQTKKDRLKYEKILNVELERSKKIEEDAQKIFEKEVDSKGNIINATEKLKEKTEDLDTTNKKVGNGIGKQLLTMGAWIVVIAAVTYAITELIEWLNRIPEDVKIKLELETESLNKSKGLQENIKKFALDYNKASRDGNKERMTELEKYAQKEYELSADKIKGIKDNVNEYRKAFKEYLKIAKDTYFNEALAKKKVESEVNRDIAKVQKLSAENEFRSTYKNDPKKAEKFISLINSGQGSPIPFGAEKRLQDAITLFNESNDAVKVLNKITFRPVDMGTGKVDPGKGGKGGKGGTSTVTTKTSLNKGLGIKKPLGVPEPVDYDTFYKPILDNEIRYTNEQEEILKQNSEKKNVIYDDDILVVLDREKRMEEARQRDLNNELSYQQDLKDELEDKVDLFNVYNSMYKENVKELEDFSKNKSNLQNTLILLEEELNKATTEEQVKSINTRKNYVNEQLILLNTETKSKEEQKVSLENLLKTYDGTPEKLIEITDKIAQLNVEISNSTETSVDREKRLWDARIQMAYNYLTALSDVASGFADISQGNMDLINAEYDRQQWVIEENVTNEEDKNDQLYKLDMKRWEVLQKDFENQKKWKEAQALIDLASGSVGIWAAPGITSLAPFGYILAGIQQAALLATTMGNIKSIRAQQMLKPHSPSSGGSGSGGSGVNIALNPVKDALTSNSENLNTMSKSNMKDLPESVVRVSEINEVQSRVSVRESNSKY